MEHSSHSHPLPDGYQQRHESPTTNASPSFSAASVLEEQPNDELNPQSRKLQIRNAKFSAPFLSTRRISPLFGLSSKENTPLKQERRPSPSEALHPSPVGILQEIQNSARRKRTHARTSLSGIFEDEPAMDENQLGLVETSWYDEKSNECSPATIRTPGKMGLREAALNSRLTSPIRPSSAKRAQRREGGLADAQPDNVEQSKYIEHLESQLASALAKIDTLTSPKTNRMRSQKLRNLTMENRNLKEENTGWAKKAEDMLHQERMLHSALESEMRAKMEEWREDLEGKESRIMELEWEMESMNAKIKDADGLLEANASLEKRIEILSNLVMNSPSKATPRSTATSPRKHEPKMTTKRPSSMLYHTSSSPPALRHSLASTSEVAFWDSRSRSPSSIIETPEEDLQQESGREFPALRPQDGTLRSSETAFQFNDTNSAGNRSHDSTSFRSAPSSSSRPTSFISTSSAGAPPWGFPVSAGSEARTASRQRKMRRFPSGSSSLKPLILPKTTSVPSLPASAPLFPSIDAISNQDITNSQMDPMAAAFLTRLVNSQTDDTPTGPPRHRSPTWAREQTLNALEGKRVITEESQMTNTSTENAAVAPDEALKAEPSPHKSRRRPHSLRRELEEAELRLAQLNALQDSSQAQDNPAANASIGGRPVNPDADIPGSGSASLRNPRHAQQPGCETSPKRSRKVKPRPPPMPDFKARPTRQPCPQHAQGLFSRLTHVVSQTRQDPVTLARRIVNNAWTLGSSSLGGIAWWLIGPLHHHKHTCVLNGRDADPAADGHGGPPWPHLGPPNGQRRRNRRGFPDYGATWGGESSDPFIGGNTVPAILPSARGEPHLFPCDECQEPSSRRTIRLWFHFCLSIVLTVGMAVKHGPGALISVPQPHTGSPAISSDGEQDEASGMQQFDQPREQEEMDVDDDATIRLNPPTQRGLGSSGSAGRRDGLDSGYGSMAFTEPTLAKDLAGG